MNIKRIIIGTLVFTLLINTKFPYIHIKKDNSYIEYSNKQDNKIYGDNKVVTSKDYNFEKDIKKEYPEAILKGKEVKIEPEWIDIRVSFYTISKQCTNNLRGISASGKDLKTLSRGGDGINNNITYIATPSSIPFGTRMYIENIGLCEVVDRGSAIKWIGNTMKVDVFIPNATNQELIGKGIIKTRGYIIKEGD